MRDQELLDERKPRGRLTPVQRAYIECLSEQGLACREIGKRIGVSHTTVSRELKRLPKGRYDAARADLEARRLAKRPKARKLDMMPDLRAYVVAGLAIKWSPEQISRNLRRDYPDEEGMRISHESIYQALYVQGYSTLRHELGVECALRSGRTGRRPRSRLASRTGRNWLQGAEISARPPEVADRAIPGHWEGDLIVGTDGKSCLVTLVERKSRFLLMSRLDAHDAHTVSERMTQMASGIPDELKGSITWDQGSEMACVRDFEMSSGFKVWFCDPHSPWQRPTNENTNGLIREFFPKGTDFRKVSDDEVAEAQWLLNNRPRKVLGWRFPSEAMMDVLEDGAMIA